MWGCQDLVVTFNTFKIGDDADEEHRGYLTTERSQANIDIAEWAESWIEYVLHWVLGT